MTLDDLVAAQQPPDSLEQMAQRQAYQSPQVPNPNFGGLGGRLNQASVGLQNGLGRLKDQLFPVDQNSGVTPEQAQALKGNALIKLGLGMIAAKDRGARLGEAAYSGYQGASTDLNGALQNAYQNALQSKHLAVQEKQLNASLQNQQIDNERAQQQFQYQQHRDQMNLEQQKSEADALKNYRNQELKLREIEAKAKQGDASTIETTANAIANYELAPLTPYAMRQPWGQQVMARVLAVNPQYQANEFTSRSKAYKDFGTGKNGNTVRSFNVALSHLDTLSGLADALNNGDIQAINTISNFYKTQTGQTAPSNFESAKKVVTDEVVKAIVGSGGGVADREKAEKTIAAQSSPAQLKGVIATYQQLMGGQLQGLRQQYEQTTGRSDFDSMLSPEAQNWVKSHGAAGASSAPAQIKGDDDYAKLPSGATFIGPDGKLRRKP